MEHTPQEYANFLNKTIVCFNLRNGKYEYRAIDNDCKPFVMAWEKYLTAINEAISPEAFYEGYRWKLVKLLATEKYDSFFKMSVNGNIRFIDKNENNEHFFAIGNVYTFSEAENLNFIVDKWDKNIYKPNNIVEIDDLSEDDISITEENLKQI